MLTQQNLGSLAAQRDQVEITQVKLTSCLEYAEGSLQTCRDSEVLAMKAPVLTRIEQITAEFDPDTDQLLEIDVELELVTDFSAREKFSVICFKLLDVRKPGPNSLSLRNSYIKTQQLQSPTTGEQAVVFHAVTRQNKEYKGKLDLNAELEHIKSKDRVQCEVVKQRNGQHKINYRPVKRGKHELHLTGNWNPTRNGRFAISVIPSAQTLNKPIRIVRDLNYPRGTALTSKGQIVVLEDKGTRVSVLTPDGEKIRTFGSQGSEPGELSGAYGVTVDKDDNIYVADNGNHRVQKFNLEGEFVATVGDYILNEPLFHNPVDIQYNHRDNNLYITDSSNHRIQVLTTDLRFVRSFGKQGTKNGQFQYPDGIAFDDANNVYVTDYNNHRVQVLTSDGHFLRTFSKKAKGELNCPWAIAIDSSNTVYVSEAGSNCVSVFTSQGTYITTFGAKGTEEGQFNKIYGLSIDQNDSIVVSDVENKRLQIYS